MNRISIWVRYCLSVIAFVSVPALAAATTPSAEYQLKASYLYHFTKFITWPDTVVGNPQAFQLCVLGSDPFGKALDALSGKATSLGEIKVRRLTRVEDAGNCHLTFVNLGSDAASEAALAQLSREGSLTIGESEKFLERGGVMRFVTVDDRVRFEVSEANVRRARLAVGAKLLSVAIRK